MDPIGLQELPPFPAAVIRLPLSVFFIAQERPARMGHLTPDLVRAPCHQRALHERQPARRSITRYRVTAVREPFTGVSVT